MTTYQQVKDKTRSYSEWVTNFYKGDKDAIRQSLNDYADIIGKDYGLTVYQTGLLANYVCKLRPQD